MKFTSFMVGLMGLLLVWFVVAVVVGSVMAIIFPCPEEHVMAGIGLGWRNIPGTIAGALAGLQSFRTSIKVRKMRPDESAPDERRMSDPHK